MKMHIFKLLLILLMPSEKPAPPQADELSGRHTESKEIRRNYQVSPNALLEIENKYGEIDITTWDQDKVEMVVTLKTNGNDKEAVQKRLEELDVIFKNSPSRVSAKTYLESSRNSFFSWFRGSGNVNIEINYKIKAPVGINLNLENDYGSVNIDRLEGNANISVDYGQLLVGELMGDDNVIEMDYTRNSKFGYIRKGSIEADYSDYTIEEAGMLNISADYSNTKVRKVEFLEFSCDYGSIDVGQVKNIKGDGDYLSTTIDSVYGSLDLNLDYGSATIRQMMRNMESLTINSDYTTLKIGYFPDSSWRYRLNSSYAGIRGIDQAAFNNLKQHQSGSKRYYEGYHNSDSGAVVTIDASYGGINFSPINQ